MSEPEITREVTGAKGQYVLEKDGAKAELTYSIASPGLIIADHTGVADALRGTGAGLALVMRMVADARDEGFKIVPLCPYVNHVRKTHPEWAEVFST